MNTKKEISQIIKQDSNISQLSPIVKTNHAQQRTQQRGINNDMIKVALTYGTKDYSFGAVRFTLTDRSLSHTPYAKLADSLRGLRVVCQPTDTEIRIITTAWHIKTKQRVR
jgi:hypothetical protein